MSLHDPVLRRLSWPAALLFAAAGAVAAPAAAPWIDISAPIDPETSPVYPGNAPVKLEFQLDYGKGDSLALSTYSFGAHAGTHVDAPMHFLRGAASVDSIPLERFIGPVRIIDIPPEAMVIDVTELNRHPWRGAERLFFRTRSSRYHWMSDARFHEDFTYLAPEAAQLLADGGVTLVGIDYLSIEQFNASEPRTHRMLLGKGIPIIEGLRLDEVAAGDFDLMLLPLKVIGHEGAPARAVIRRR